MAIKLTAKINLLFETAEFSYPALFMHIKKI